MPWPLLIVVTIACLGWPQNPATSSRPPLAVPPLEKGAVEGNTYRNPSLGLELTADPSLKFQSLELKDRGTKRESLSVMALGKFKSGTPRGGAAIAAIALAQYSEDQRSTDSCVRRVGEAQQKDGFKRVRDSSPSELGHTTFARSDFLKEGPVYEATFVKACETLALIIIFAGHDQNTVEKFVAATDFKLDPASSGCTPELIH